LTGAIYTGQIANNRMTELCSVPNITWVLNCVAHPCLRTAIRGALHFVPTADGLLSREAWRQGLQRELPNLTS